jgi:hypothetical protein
VDKLDETCRARSSFIMATQSATWQLILGNAEQNAGRVCCRPRFAHEILGGKLGSIEGSAYVSPNRSRENRRRLKVLGPRHDQGLTLQL